jgi:hypothetical protein
MSALPPIATAKADMKAGAPPLVSRAGPRQCGKIFGGAFVADTRLVLGCPVVRVVVRWCSGWARSSPDLLPFFGATIIFIKSPLGAAPRGDFFDPAPPAMFALFAGRRSVARRVQRLVPIVPWARGADAAVPRTHPDTVRGIRYGAQRAQRARCAACAGAAALSPY